MFFGRKPESKKLREDFSQVQKGGWKQVMIKGPAGVGKTALVSQFALEAELCLGSFVFGKADLRRSQIPLAPIRTILNMMVKKAIADHPGDMAAMARAISDRLGTDLGQALFLVPALKFLIDDTIEYHEVKSGEDETPFLNNLLYGIIDTFAPRFKGLAIFLDDLQWFDPASHIFLAHLAVAPPLSGVFLIMGFRDQVDNFRPGLSKTQDMFQGVDTCRQFTLKGLPKRDIKALLKNRLNTEQILTPLSDLCFEKTRGNPFYLTQMVEDLLDRGAVRKVESEWTYDLRAISALGFTENVADLIIFRIRLLNEDALMLLKHCACFQEGIWVDVLSATAGLAPEKIESLLWKPVKLHFLEKIERQYNFSHDKILEAVEDLITSEEKIEIHKQLTAFYLSVPPGDASAPSVFTLLYHYGFYADGVMDQDLKKKMVRHYFLAGQKAWAQAAYSQALEWFSQGKTHFPGDIWQADYDLALAFCNGVAECAYLAGDFKAAKAIFIEIDEKVERFEDRLNTEMVKISCYQATDKLKQAQAKGIEVLCCLGIHIPESPSWPRVIFAIFKTWAVLVGSRSLSKTKKQTPAQGQIRQIIKVMTSLGGISFILSPNKFLPYITAVALEFTLRHGNTPETPTLYVAFGMVLNRVTGFVKWGKKLSSAARDISKESGTDSLNGKEMLLSTFFLEHWDHSIQKTVEAFESGQQICIEQGDHEYYGYHTILSITCLLLSEHPLDRILARITREKTRLKQLNHPYGGKVLSIQERALSNLNQGVDRPWELGSDFLDENNLREKSQGLFFELIFHRVCAAFFCGDIKAALGFKQEMEASIDEMAGTPTYYYFYFMSAIIEIRADNSLKKAKKCLKLLNWCRANNPGVYGPKYMIARGEFLRAQNRIDKAEPLFYEAQKALEENPDALYEKGLVYENLGLIARTRDNIPESEKFFKKAENLYRSFGLKYKLGLFERKPDDERDQSESDAPETKAGALNCPDPEPCFQNDLEKTLFAILDESCAGSVHAVVLDALKWKTRIQVTKDHINYPAAFVDLPDKMLTFAGTAGKVLKATAGDSEEEFFDTAYFFKHHPVSLVVIPEGNNRAVFIENPKKTQNMDHLIRLAETVFESLEVPAHSQPPLPEKDPEEILRFKSCCSMLLSYMKQNTPYKDPSLSLVSLSSSLGISQRMITDAVNTCLGQNFQTFISSHRIEAVKAEMRDLKNDEKTILEIGFEQGFNSKSAFNRSFKTQTGMTPSEYKKLNARAAD